MQSMLRAVSALAFCASLGACATVTRGTTTDFKVSSAPPGASVSTSTGFACSPTPCTIAKMPRKTAFDATVTLAGYQPQTVHVASKVSGGGGAGFAGNLVAGGVLGMVIDGSDGSMNDLSPNPLAVTLVPVGAPPAAASTAPPAPGALSEGGPPSAGQ
jgi:hypothetical protein